MLTEGRKAFHKGLFGVPLEEDAAKRYTALRFQTEHAYEAGRELGKKYEGFFAMMAATTGLTYAD